MQRPQFRMIRHADTADTRQRLREGADDEVDLREHSLGLGAAEPGCAVRSKRMRLVHQNVRAMGAADVHDVAQRRDVAANRIQAFDHDEPIPPAVREPVELPPQALRRVVTERHHL